MFKKERGAPVKPQLLSKWLFCGLGTNSFRETRAAAPSSCVEDVGSHYCLAMFVPPLRPGKALQCGDGPSLNPWYHREVSTFCFSCAALVPHVFFLCAWPV